MACMAGRVGVAEVCPECLTSLRLTNFQVTHQASYLPDQSHRATMSWTNDKGLKHVSCASVRWIELIRQGTEQDVV